MKRRGFTLAELLVVIVVMAVLGTALMQLMVNNSRFVSRQEAQLEARQTARAAFLVMSTELRMVTDGGLLAADSDSVTVRVPYVFGITCEESGGATIASLMPADSMEYASATADGVALLGSSGSYTFPSGGITVASSTQTSACTTDSIRTIAGGRLVALSKTGIATPGTLFYLYETVTYRFGSSTTFPGRTALWRRAGSSAATEMLAPFNAASGFGFLVGSRLTSQSTPPAQLSTVQGLELRLYAESVATPNGASTPSQFDLRTNVKFLNREMS